MKGLLATQVWNWEIVGVVLVFIVSLIGIALYVARKDKGMSDYFIGGMKIPFFVVAFSVTAAQMSGWGFVGMPGMTYQHGWALGATIHGFAAFGMILGYYLLAKPMRQAAAKLGTLTVPDILAGRYQNNSLRLIAALGILIGTLGYQASQYQALAAMIQAIIPVTYLTALFVGVFILTAIVLFGGMKSVAFTDFLQTIVMLIGVAFILYMGLKLTGGLTEANAALASVNPDWVKLFHEKAGPVNIWSFFSIMLVVSVGWMGQPHIIGKFFQLDKKIGLKWACILSVSSFIFVCFAFYTGIWQRALEIQGKTAVIANPDLACPVFIATNFHPLMAGIIFAAVLAAIVSTAGAFIIVACSAVVRDIIQNWYLKGKKLTEKQELVWTRVATAGVIVVTTALAIEPIALVGWLGLASWGIYAATLTAPLVIGLWWRRATPTAALVSSLVGLVGGLTLFFLKMNKIYTWKADPIGVAFLVAIILMFVISLATKPVKNPYWD